MKALPVETERFLLRPFEATDIDDLFAMESDPRVHIYLGNNPLTHKEQVEHVIKGVQEQYERNGLGRLIIIEKSTGNFVGWSGLKYEEHIRPFGYYDLGYRLLPKYWGQGVATETGLGSLRYGFEALQLQEVNGAAEIPNIASNRVLEKCGLSLTDTFEFEEVVHNWYAITATEWEAQNA